MFSDNVDTFLVRQSCLEGLDLLALAHHGDQEAAHALDRGLVQQEGPGLVLLPSILLAPAPHTRSLEVTQGHLRSHDVT